MIERKDDYTPTTDDMRDLYVRHADSMGIASDHVLRAEFHRWLSDHEEEIRREEREAVAAELSAAEQRGAAEALREVANMSDAWQNLFRKDVDDQTAYMLAWRLRIALHNRADTYHTITDAMENQ